MTRSLATDELQPGIETRFWKKVDRSGGPDACWLWTAATNPNGYGVVLVFGRNRGVHRVAWQMSTGRSPRGLVIRHACDTPLCVNPAHLLAGTQADNIADKARRNRQAQGDTSGRSKLTGANVLVIRERFSAGEYAVDLAAEYGVNASTILRAIRGHDWKHLPGATAKRHVPRRRRGEENPRAVLQAEDVLAIRAALGSGISRKELQARYGVSKTLIAHIARRLTWTHV